jgi:hypothetical protein
MNTPIKVRTLWDAEAHVWIATSDDVPGLVVEAESLRSLIKEVRLALPELLAVWRDDTHSIELLRD